MTRAILRSRLLAGTTGLLAAVALLPTAEAQDTGRGLHDGVTVTVTRTPGTGVAVAAPGVPEAVVDESALRFYAARYDYEKVDAEIRRLQEIDPNWQVPADLFSPQAAGAIAAPPVDERPLWALFNAGDIAGVEREIAVLRQLHPGWQPPDELVALIEEQEIDRRMTVATAAGDSAAVLAVFAERPDGFSCRRVDWLWALADAHFAEGREAAAYEVYRRILATCEDAGHRLSTLQKALANRVDDRLPELFAMEEGQPRTAEQQARWEQIVVDWQGGGDGGTDGRLGMALAALAEGDTAELDWIEATARERRDANAAQVLGWHWYDTGAHSRAADWFETSMSWAPSAEAAEGLAYAYQRLGRRSEAIAIAREWRDRRPQLAALVPRPGSSGGGGGGASSGSAAVAQFEGRNFGAVLSLTENTEDAGLLVLRGWSFYNLGRKAEAAQAFEAALTGATGSALGDAAYGLARTLVDRGLHQQARAMVDRYDMDRGKEVELMNAILEGRARDAFDRGDYIQVLSIVRTADVTNESAQSLAFLEAWSLYHMGRYEASRDRFRQLYQMFATAEAMEGLQLAEARLRPNY